MTKYETTKLQKSEGSIMYNFYMKHKTFDPSYKIGREQSIYIDTSTNCHYLALRSKQPSLSETADIYLFFFIYIIHTSTNYFSAYYLKRGVKHANSLSNRLYTRMKQQSQSVHDGSSLSDTDKGYTLELESISSRSTTIPTHCCSCMYKLSD